MRTRRVATCLLAAGLVLLFSSPASAGVDDGVNSNAFVGDGAAVVELTGVSPGDKVTGPGLDPGLRDCSWGQWTLLQQEMFIGTRMGSSPSEDAVKAELINDGRDPDELWNNFLCPQLPDNGVGFGGLGMVVNGWLATDPLPQSFFDWLIAYGYALVEIPLQSGSSSPVGDLNAPLIAQLDTWMWVDPSVWGPVSATTPEVFGVTATVTATPSSAEFETSEGEYINCGANTGAVYDYSAPASSQSTACSVTFRNASSVANQWLTSTVRWTVTYDCSSAACPSGTLPDFVIVTTRDVRVAEIVGVGTSNGN